MSDGRRIVVAIGGNALSPEGQPGSLTGQHDHATEFSRVVAELVAEGWQVVVTHGNGPQVGYILRRGELVRDVARAEGLPDLPLWLAVADSQGGMGHILTVALDSALERVGVRSPAAYLLTHVEIDPDDPAFADPTKPIGGVLAADAAAYHRDVDGWSLVRTGPTSYRRVVASPRPIRVVEADHVRTLLDAGALVVAGGGGGIPVHRGADGEWTEADAVIDKDRTSALLAAAVDADILVLVTGVPAICTGFGTPDQAELSELGTVQARELQRTGEFPPGSMGPKVEAALSFVSSGGDALVTSIASLRDALAGRAGTRMSQRFDDRKETE
jgi:carbamate kinase